MYSSISAFFTPVFVVVLGFLLVLAWRFRKGLPPLTSLVPGLIVWVLLDLVFVYWSVPLSLRDTVAENRALAIPLLWMLGITLPILILTLILSFRCMWRQRAHSGRLLFFTQSGIWLVWLLLMFQHILLMARTLRWLWFSGSV